MPRPASRIVARTGGGRYREGGFDAAIAIDYVDGVVLDAVVAPLATRKVGIAPFSTMTRLGHDFLIIGIIRKHTFTEAPASAVDAIWFADRDNPPAFDPNRLWKGSAMRYVLKLAFEFLVVMLKITGYSFGLLFLVLGELSANSESSETEYWCGESDDGYDQFGSPMTPGEEGMGLVSRKHYL